MAQFVFTEDQLIVIKKSIIAEKKYEKKDLINEAWYNTVMDVLGIIDPTPIIDIINATSYFIQGDTLFGVLTIVSAIPYAGDIVAKPVLGVCATVTLTPVDAAPVREVKVSEVSVNESSLPLAVV